MGPVCNQSAFSPGPPALIPPWPTGLPSTSQRVSGSLVGAVRDHLCRQFIVFQILCIGGHPLIHNHCHHRHLNCFATGNRMLTTALKRLHLSNLSWNITTQALLQVTSPMTIVNNGSHQWIPVLSLEGSPDPQGRARSATFPLTRAAN